MIELRNIEINGSMEVFTTHGWTKAKDLGDLNIIVSPNFLFGELHTQNTRVKKVYANSASRYNDPVENIDIIIPRGTTIYCSSENQLLEDVKNKSKLYTNLGCRIDIKDTCKEVLNDYAYVGYCIASSDEDDEYDLTCTNRYDAPNMSLFDSVYDRYRCDVFNMFRFDNDKIASILKGIIDALSDDVKPTPKACKFISDIYTLFGGFSDGMSIDTKYIKINSIKDKLLNPSNQSVYRHVYSVPTTRFKKECWERNHVNRDPYNYIIHAKNALIRKSINHRSVII